MYVYLICVQYWNECLLADFYKVSRNAREHSLYTIFLLLGYRSVHNPYFGASIGRVCNRVGFGKFILNGKTYNVDKNFNGKHQLHGGSIGFDKFVWNAYRSGSKVIMSHVNPDNFQGYPGTVLVNATFELLPNNTFSGIFTATVSEPTPIILTNHSYFNLAGHVSKI